MKTKYLSAPLSRYKVFFISLLALFLYLTSYQLASASQPSLGDGYVDSATFDNDKLTIQGWAGAPGPSQQIVAISVAVDGKPVYEGPFERLQRPDVSSAMHRGDWLRSGWRLSFRLADDIPAGPHTIEVQAVPDAGGRIQLTNSEQVKTFNLPNNIDHSKRAIRITKALIALILLSLVIVFFTAERISKRWFNSRISAPYIFAAAILFSFFSAVAMGLSGSSLSLGIQQSPFVQGDMTKIWGKDQPIRSDEWLVLTPLAIAQYNHIPKNPVINSNHGEDGQNMLIVGMTGVPVAHISEIAKPATWGFFLFDLKRALAWDWCFPFFGCLLALWGVFCVVMPNQWKANFLASLLFNISPYIIGWSHWPAYAAFFPSIIFLSALKITETSGLWRKIFLAVPLGASLAGFVFVLYPPWQVSLGYLFIAITIGVLIRDKTYKTIDIKCCAAYTLAIGIALILLAAWWVDAKSAIEAMEATVYPGQRTTVLGGNLTLSFILRGFTNIQTLQALTSPLSNQSEISSFYYMLIPLAVSFIIALYRKMITSVDICLTIFIVFSLFFMMVGIPEPLAKFSLWGRVPSNRADLSLGLGSLILACSLLSKLNPSHPPSNLLKVIATVSASIWAYVVYRSIQTLDDSIVQNLTNGVLSAILITTAAIGYALVSGNLRNFLYLNLALAGATTITMNPLNIAPKNINNNLSSPATVSLKKSDKILVLSNMLPSMYLVASGSHTINGIYYYPQKSIWARLDPTGTNSNTYNRYQHLFYTIETPGDGADFNITTPQPDVVKININTANFDFSITGATVVAAPSSEDSALKTNRSLALTSSINGWSWYRVISLTN